MKSLLFPLAAWLAGSSGASADTLCAAAQAGLEQFAQARGLGADVRCRLSTAGAVPKDAKLSALAWDVALTPRSGMLTWPVRVETGNGRTYLQQVPLTVAWTAPAWVAVRSLSPGAALRPSDMALKSTRWPDGLVVQAADPQSPPSGRLRQGHRAGDILTATSLMPPDVLMRGDAVTVVLAQGAVEIRMPAQLLSPSRIGELARAQALGRQTPLEGRLVDLQTLWVVGL